MSAENKAYTRRGGWKRQKDNDRQLLLLCRQGEAQGDKDHPPISSFPTNATAALDYLKNMVNENPLYARTEEDLAVWNFLNHISLLYFYGLVRALRKSGLEGKYTPWDFLDIERNIYRGYGFDPGPDPVISEVSQKDREILASLGVDIFRKN